MTDDERKLLIKHLWLSLGFDHCANERDMDAFIAAIRADERARCEAELNKSAQSVPDAPDGHIVLDQLNDILYGTLDSRSYGPMQTGDNNGLARDLCHEYIKDAMQDRETRRYAKKWVVRPFKLLAAAPKPPGEE